MPLTLRALQVAFIDTEGTFRAEKIRAIAARFDLDADAVLDNVSPLSPVVMCLPWWGSWPHKRLSMHAG